MPKTYRWPRTLVMCAALCASLAQAAAPVEPEAVLRQTMQEAVWPADVVKAAERYEASYPQGDWLDAARSLKAQAARSMDLLARNDIRLFTTSVEQVGARPGFKALARQALLGDAEAARQLAHRWVVPRSSRFVGWLQWAAALGNEKAAYELALHFRTEDQPLLASQYEARAVALGFTPPTVLDHIRK